MIRRRRDLKLINAREERDAPVYEARLEGAFVGWQENILEDTTEPTAISHCSLPFTIRRRFALSR